MAESANVTVQAQLSGGTPSAVKPVFSGDSIIQQSFTINNNASNTQVNIGFEVSHIKMMKITVDPHAGGAVTLRTNSTGSPAHTKVFAAAPSVGNGNLLYWDETSCETNPFGSTDVTTTYWSNADVTNSVEVTVQVLLTAIP